MPAIMEKPRLELLIQLLHHPQTNKPANLLLAVAHKAPTLTLSICDLTKVDTQLRPVCLNINKANKGCVHFFQTNCIYCILSTVQYSTYRELRLIYQCLVTWYHFSLLQNMGNKPNVQPMYKFYQALPNSLYLPVHSS